MSNYWMISAPNVALKSPFEGISSKLDKQSGYCKAYRVAFPTFRVGTLDSLMSVSDALSKDDKFLESGVDRILRQYRELDSQENPVPLVEGKNIDAYLRGFEWDEAKFASTEKLEDIKNTVVEQVARLEEDLKIRSNDYTQVKQTLQAIERKNQGNLMARSLAKVVTEKDVIETEHMTTAYVVFPKYNESEFLKCYESLAALVVPRSGQKLSEDSDYVLYAVTVFKKGLEEFKTNCREKRFTIREFKFDPESAEKEEQDYERLTEESKEQYVTFHQWSETAFGEAFIAMVHLKVLRSFVESVLRYGLPVNFEIVLVHPSPKMETRLRTALNDMFKDLGGNWATGGDSDTAVIPGVVNDKDFYPYVSVEVPVPHTHA